MGTTASSVEGEKPGAVGDAARVAAAREYADMPDARRAALWRQRLHEAEAGLTRLIVRLGSTDLADWFVLKARIFADLPESGSAAAEWQRVFFRGQALMEQFLVRRHGEDILTGWTTAISEVHRDVEPDLGGGAADPIRRIARQAELYESVYELNVPAGHGPVAAAALDITHCAIWDYRERARDRGVRLTLESPCTFCTKAMSANIRAKGYSPSYRLYEGAGGHGCHWEATAREEPAETSSEA